MTSYFAPEKTSPDGWSDPGPASRRRGVPALCLDRLRIECQRALEHFDRRAGASRVRVAPSAVPPVALPPRPDRADRAGNLFRTTIAGDASNDSMASRITDSGSGSAPVFTEKPSKARSYGQSIATFTPAPGKASDVAPIAGALPRADQHLVSHGSHLAPGQRRRAFVSMLVLVPLGGAATDIYIPSLPAMAEHFDAARFSIQSTLLVFMACYGIGQIIAGPLTDTFGRRLPALLSTMVFVFASIGIALGPPLWALIALRGVQGVFVACSAVGARAIVADCYDGAERSKASNWMTVAWATGPILSPALGGYLQLWFGWTASFWFLTGWGAVVVLVALLVLPETRDGRIAGRFCTAFRLYGQMATDRVYLPTALGMACVISVMYGFEAMAPFYVQTDLGHGPVFYGHLQLVLGSLWLAGNIFNRFVSVHQRVIRIITAAAGMSLLVSLLMLVLDLHGVFNVVALAVAAGAVYFLMAMIWPNGYPKCLGRFPDAGGSANALVSGLFIVVSASFMATASMFAATTAWPMWLLYVCVTAATLVCFRGFLAREFDYKIG
jgi:MFS family permease